VTDTIPPPPTTTTLPPTALPSNSGEGRRVVYSKSRQRVWTVEADGTVSRTYAVSGRLTWNQPTPNNPANQFEPQPRYYSNPPAYYRVFSRSANTCNIKKPYICWRYMVRFTQGDEGDNIGFHEIPINTNTGRPVQDLSQLGTALSNGCVRQAPADALHMWNWAPVGTKVYVLA
jgi:lipoprotein-anchoring transpeptidase ErfK/SrfK